MEELALYKVFDSIDSNVQYLFKDLVKLKKLKMNSNKIDILKSTYFEYLLNLEELDLEQNKIKSIESMLKQLYKDGYNIEVLNKEL